MSQRTGFYERYSVWILAILVFLLPMVVVGAIKAKGNNRNDVKGWLPLEYPETQTYRFFRQNFQGEEFILVSWDGCTMADPRLELLARKLLPPPEEASRIGRPIYFKTAQTGPRAVEQMTDEPLNLDREEAVDQPRRSNLARDQGDGGGCLVSGAKRHECIGSNHCRVVDRDAGGGQPGRHRLFNVRDAGTAEPILLGLLEGGREGRCPVAFGRREVGISGTEGEAV
jgi:hypothetical protein